MIDWGKRAFQINHERRFWATPDPWAACRAAVRSVDRRMSKTFLALGNIPAGWDCSDFMQLCAGEMQ